MPRAVVTGGASAAYGSDAIAGVLLGTTIALGSALITHRVRERRAATGLDDSSE